MISQSYYPVSFLIVYNLNGSRKRPLNFNGKRPYQFAQTSIKIKKIKIKYVILIENELVFIQIFII